MKKQITFLMILSLVLTSCIGGKNLRECPDIHVIDKMPGTDVNDEGRQYYIVEGERAEIRDFDGAWVDENCDVEVQEVS